MSLFEGSDSSKNRESLSCLFFNTEVPMAGCPELGEETPFPDGYC